MKMSSLIISLIILSILGILISSYLILSRIKQKPVSCHIGHNCNKVLESEWSKIFLIKNDILGAVYYLIIIIGALYFFFVSRNILILMKIISGISLLFSIFLLYVQSRIIKNYCFYCITTSFLNLFIFLNILILNRA